MNPKERLRILIDDIKFTKELNNEDLGKALGYKAKNAISDILGQEFISDKVLDRFKRYFSVNPEYVKTGFGTEYLRDTPQKNYIEKKK